MYFWYLTTVNHWYIFTPSRRYTAPREALKPHPLFNNQRNNQQTALPLPATGARQPRKAAHDRENPVRLTKAKCLNRVNDLASNAPR